MQRDYKVSLSDIKDAIKRIKAYTKGMSFKDFSSDLLVQDAVLRNLAVIGEAAKNLPEEITKKSDEVEWKDLAGLRDILMHQYFGVDLETIWGVIETDLPKLDKCVSNLLK